jgi:hypothetical protein
MIKFNYKGIPDLQKFSQEEEIRALEKSVYGEWYEFARLSPVLWCAHRYDLKIQSAALRQVASDFGNVWSGSFYSWAKLNARNLFPEQQPYDAIEILQPVEQRFFIPTPTKFAITVPMTIRRQTLLKQFRALLDEHHLGRKLEVLKVSHTAKYKIHTRQFRKNVLENERLVLIYRWLYPKTPMWVIADRLQLSPANKVRDEGFHIRANKKECFSRLNSIGGRHLYKAKRRVMNLELGSFPNATDLDEPHEMPFGKSRHEDYVALTLGKKGTEKTVWRKWLEKEYFRVIERVVLDRNRVKTPMLTDKDVKNFLSGKTNTL